MSADALVALLKDLNEKAAQFESRAVDDHSERVTVRMTAPRRIDFDLVSTKQINSTIWRIVAIHP
jgi:hypothetical protein